MAYKILITRSMLGHFFWTLKGSNGKMLAESGMISSKENCQIVVNPLARILKAKVSFIDLEKDYDEEYIPECKELKDALKYKLPKKPCEGFVDKILDQPNNGEQAIFQERN